ncbi:hypothetical protein MTY81_01600 [Mycolicibacterium sp. TY81]|nr:hypothetical protein MTY81_01600 [Mycolicibacterium sp. TY81]
MGCVPMGSALRMVRRDGNGGRYLGRIARVCAQSARPRGLSPLGWWEFGDGAEVGGDVQAVSVPVLGWAIA